MSHFSPVPPDGRRYARNYRKELEPFEAQLVEVTGRCKEFRDHPERKDLQSMLLVNITVKPLNGPAIKLSHLWVLTKHIHRVGIEPKEGKRMRFIGSVYAYFRLGGKSKQRGLRGMHDFSILPMEIPDIESFEPGVNNRYEVEDAASDGGTAEAEKGASREVGPAKARRSRHTNRRRRNDGDAPQGS